MANWQFDLQYTLDKFFLKKMYIYQNGHFLCLYTFEARRPCCVLTNSTTKYKLKNFMSYLVSPSTRQPLSSSSFPFPDFHI